MEKNQMIDEFLKLYGGEKEDIRIFASPQNARSHGKHHNAHCGRGRV